MGQAWCKEKSEKAQDSKSPLDRVFVRCAHRIYPGLKEDGSVLGGASQRVTSSEIGYAGSPPRAALLRGQSIDSVDRPFHPSEWVDVNLEVPCTPSGTSKPRDSSGTLEKVELFAGRASPRTKTRRKSPVPPPRRRRPRQRRPDEESEPETHCSHLRLVAEISQLKRSLEEVSRAKNPSATSLPNVLLLLLEAERSDAGVQLKTGSLPSSLGAPQSWPERRFLSFEGDNSIFKLDSRFETDIKTSTPVKQLGDSAPLPDTSSQNISRQASASLPSASSAALQHESSSNDEASSAIRRDFEEPGIALVQRTISEESLPREMLEELEDELKSKANECEDSRTPAASSMTPSLLELEAALSDMLERKDEEERSRSLDRTNPFNESLREFEPPEKPSRLHRISLIEESIDEPLILPTPPRRRHRSKSNLNSSSAVAEVLRRSSYNDRLI